MLHRPTSAGQLTALVVASGARRQGLGRALVVAAEQLVREAGCALVEVTSHQRHVQAHEFYRHIGFEFTSYRFRKELPSPEARSQS